MAFRKPITTLGGLFWWKNIKQSEYFLMQEHTVGTPAWPYKYRITLRENRMEVANTNDRDEIKEDWKYLEKHIVPQIDQKIDAGEVLREIDVAALINTIIKLAP